ncbi:TIGR04282 family arsenosugar biosynthesis glycosyltransferase [Hyunsoonleella ulvae]|uniref:TIGR04282 family arsenosugar biosynthesis glycosyltransferase n=1 Tax=Hyunsoonleella ulvae TaxID=2799948 RepID=UPI0019399788|nr:TIGR04282 family arsenosugar biosynthesis glycosyltransferase [Hyunsoonleella ulvae]
MSKALIIVFVKNIKLGTVKTRLAKTIGNHAAFEVYKELVGITEKATSHIAVDKRIYFSDVVIDSKWEGFKKFVQEGEDLGIRMKNAFTKGFEDGYNRIVLIGSDLPDINALHIEKGLDALNDTDTVFGPAVDGGYYLVGLSKLHDCIFNNKPWSKPDLFENTIKELQSKNINYSILETLNDIDTFEDLVTSKFYKNNLELQDKIKQLNN